MQDRATIISANISKSREEDMYHEKWGNDPVDEQAERELSPEGLLTNNMMEDLVADFTQDGIHHDEKSDS